MPDDPQAVGDIRLTIRERRELGLTVFNVARIVRELDQAGELDRNDRAATSAQVLERIIADNPQAVRNAVGERDWASFLEALMRFIEAILPIILMFMG